MSEKISKGVAERWLRDLKQIDPCEISTECVREMMGCLTSACKSTLARIATEELIIKEISDE